MTPSASEESQLLSDMHGIDALCGGAAGWNDYRRLLRHLILLMAQDAGGTIERVEQASAMGVVIGRLGHAEFRDQALVRGVITLLANRNVLTLTPAHIGQPDAIALRKPLTRVQLAALRRLVAVKR